jgi:flagellin
MLLGIRNNLLSENVQRNLKTVSREYQKEVLELSSGKRINQASDDPAGLAMAKLLEGNIRSLRQANRNANEGLSLVQTAEGGLNEIGNILLRLRELAIQSSSDVIGDEERGLLQAEFSELHHEIDRISRTTELNGVNLLNGSMKKIDVQVGIHAGEDHRISLNAKPLVANTDIFDLDDDDIESKDDSLDSLSTLDRAISKVSEQRAQLGAYQSRLTSAISNLESMTFNSEEARSVIEDADIAKAASRMVTLGIIQEAGISTLAQVNNLNSKVIRLLT